MLFREERFVKPMDLPALKFRSALRVFARVLNGDFLTRLRDRATGLWRHLGKTILLNPVNKNRMFEERTGIILYDATQTRILLVQSRFTGKWGFTKGHIEPTDTDSLASAKREVKEESGYLENHYKIINGPIHLRNRPYWVASLRTLNSPSLNNTEQSGIGWFRLKEIPHLRLNEDVRLYLASKGT